MGKWGERTGGLSALYNSSQEFSRKHVEERIFLSAMNGLGARIRTDYVAYALERFGG